MRLPNTCPSPRRRPLEWRAGTALFALAMLLTPVAAQAQGAFRAETRERVVVEIDGVTLSQFQEVSGVGAAGRTKWGEITLQRGTSGGRALIRWHEAGRGRGAASARKNGSIIVYDNMGGEVARYRFTNAWPSKIEIGALKAGASEALESVTIVYETIQRVAP